MDLKTKLKEYLEFEGEISFKLVGNEQVSFGIIKDIQDDYMKVFTGGNPQQETNVYIPFDKIISITIKEDR
ncbi:MAG: hypothetical protein KGD57_09290 [Candidatus Lokiarchaeota archaeon]|nr:hypothetical protein [Candidatus Lokiarchaeota archaeon]